MQRYKKPKPMGWHVFVGRRQLDVIGWLAANDIKSYDVLVEWCEDNNVVPPSPYDMKGVFVTKRKPRPQPQPQRPKAPKRTPLKRVEKVDPEA